MATGATDLERLEGVVASNVLGAMRTASAALTECTRSRAGLSQAQVAQAQGSGGLVELIKAGIDLDEVRRYLAANAPPLVAKLEEAVATARAEE